MVPNRIRHSKGDIQLSVGCIVAMMLNTLLQDCMTDSCISLFFYPGRTGAAGCCPPMLSYRDLDIELKWRWAYLIHVDHDGLGILVHVVFHITTMSIFLYIYIYIYICVYIYLYIYIYIYELILHTIDCYLLLLSWHSVSPAFSQRGLTAHLQVSAS